MNAVHKINGLFSLTYQIKCIIRYIRIRLKTPSYNTFHPPQKTVLLQKRTFFEKNTETFGTYQNNAYLCIAIQK